MKYPIIDAHCHIYPDKIAVRATAGTEHFYDIHAFADGTVSMLLENGGKAGIAHYVVQSVATSPAQVSGINRFIAESVAASNGKMTGLGTLHPESTHLKEDVQEILSLGLHGVKLHHDIQGFKIDDYRCLKIYELCEKHSLPILMHTGDHRYDYSNPNRLLPVMRIFTELTVVGAHLGGWSVWEDTEALAELPNLYVDCSSCFPFRGAQAMLPVMKHYGAEKILFGTDYPMWSPVTEIDNFMSLPFTEEERELILFKNAKKVFGIR